MLVDGANALICWLKIVLSSVYSRFSFDKIWFLADHEERYWESLYSQIYFSQRHDWDCGLACCVMVLNWLRKDTYAIYDSQMVKKTIPLWTIELFHILVQEGVNVSMTTTSLGVDYHHGTIDWYSQRNDDHEYINSLFADALHKSLPLEKVSAITSYFLTH